MIDFDTFTKIAKNVGDLGRLIVPKDFKSCPKSNKSPYLVTLITHLSAFLPTYVKYFKIALPNSLVG